MNINSTFNYIPQPPKEVEKVLIIRTIINYFVLRQIVGRERITRDYQGGGRLGEYIFFTQKNNRKKSIFRSEFFFFLYD